MRKRGSKSLSLPKHKKKKGRGVKILETSRRDRPKG